MRQKKSISSFPAYEVLPEKLVSYLELIRFEKPIGFLLLMWPCWFSLALNGNFEIKLYIIFFIGAFSMRSVGCIINDYFDQTIDKKVKRTFERPLASGRLKNFEALDMCSAPRGKTFQLIQKGAKVHAVEKSKGRVIKLKKNLNRLNYDSIIKIDDVFKLNEDKKYNIIIVDAPCSSIGTIRRNPDIFFKDKEINLDINIELQKQLLQKADKMLCAGGLLIYIVCSFLKKETYFPVKNFLKKNQNYSIFKYQDEKNYSKLIDDNGFINILPQRFNNFLIDGFFSARLIKND